MEKQEGLTLVGVIVTIIVILFIIAIMLPTIPNCRKISTRVVCVTNLKGLGTAMAIYANDYDGACPQLPGTGPWSKRLGFDYDNTTPDFDESGAEAKVSRTITSSLYLLVREADVFPKTFLCSAYYPKRKWFKKSESQRYTEFIGTNTKGLDPVEFWDFGPEPHKHVSYAYHNPYGKYLAGRWLPASFAVMADMNPWFDLGNIVKTSAAKEPPQIIKLIKDMVPTDWEPSNSINHRKNEQKNTDGQCVLFADGHVSYEKQPNVGVNNDNIYTFWSTEDNPTEQDTQGGTAPTSRSTENDAKSKDDSFLAI